MCTQTAKSLDRTHAMLQQTIRDAKAASDKARDIHASLLLLQIKLMGR